MTALSLPHRSLAPAIVGGLLAAASVAAELVYPVQASDGTSREPIVHALYLAAWVIGWALVAMTAAGLRSALPGSRSAAIGSWTAVGGAVAFAVSGLAQLIGVLAAGVPLEAAFVLFLLAFPLLVVANVALGLAVRARSSLAFVLFLLAAVGLLVGFLAEADPFHDIGLIGGVLAMTAAFAVLQQEGRWTPGRA